MCSSTIIYLLFTKSVHTVHPQTSMNQLVAPSQTLSETLDGHRGAGIEYPGPVFWSQRGGNRKMFATMALFK